MAKKNKKVCKKCKLFVEGDKCPACESTTFSDSWKGRVYIADSQKSIIAEKIGAKIKGEYAIKVR
jgi:DNA-directed RNA polymerase subunit E"